MDKHSTSDQQLSILMEKQTRFKREICRRQCQFCGKDVSPDFCEFLFESNSEMFLNEILSVMILARERVPRFVKELRTPEGFKALFCESKGLCDRFRSPHCMQKVDCYSVFLHQSGVPIPTEDNLDLILKWDRSRYQDCKAEVNRIKNIFESGLKPKRRRKLLKLFKKLCNLYRGAESIPRDKKARKPKNNQPKKKVTTRFFCRWPDRIAHIFSAKEGETSTCESKSETTSA